MGVYANEPALRAMAGLAHQNLVVITSNSGSNIEKPEFCHKPFDKVIVYLVLAWHSNARKGTGTVAKIESWACVVVPALLDPSEHLNIGSSFTKETSARVNQWAL